MNENFGIILVLILAFLNTVQHDIFTVISFYLIKFSFLLCYARGRELYQKKKKKKKKHKSKIPRIDPKKRFN